MTVLRLLRPHQWTKNLLILVPALAAHRAMDMSLVTTLAWSFLLFSLLASGFYVVNDLLDLEHDRAHPTKRARPVAAGEISPAGAGVTAGVLVVGSGVGMAYLLPPAFGLAALVYAVLTLAYSLGLKRAVFLDVLVLAALYTVRVVAGAAAVDVPLSRWFLAFSVFVFLSLALVKRAVELRTMAAGKATEAAPGRGWVVDDLPVLRSLGLASAVAGALVYCLYITSPDVTRLYGRPDFLWLGLPLLLYWLGRSWILVGRDEVADDPVVFALRDPASWAVVALFALTLWVAT
jgi:4-hydroxybenzoate polyprenyltransferase